MTGGDSTIVVGLDGSRASKDALSWAVAQAARTGARLEVILCWRQPVTYGYAPDYGADADFERDARHQLDELLSEVLGGDIDVPFESRDAEGHAAPILVEAALGADLLVVGSRPDEHRTDLILLLLLTTLGLLSSARFVMLALPARSTPTAP